MRIFESLLSGEKVKLCILFLTLVVLFQVGLDKERRSRSSQERTSVKECHLADPAGAQTNTYMVLQGGKERLQ